MRPEPALRPLKHVDATVGAADRLHEMRLLGIEDVLDGTAAKLSANEDVQEFYLGVTGSGRKSLRDVKHYKRRKRWLS